MLFPIDNITCAGFKGARHTASVSVAGIFWKSISFVSNISGRIRKFENRSGDVRAWVCVYVIFVYFGHMLGAERFVINTKT